MMMQNVDRFFNSPLALWPGHTSALLEMLRHPQASIRAATVLEVLQVEAQSLDMKENVLRLYELINGVAIIPIRGVLVHGASYWCWDETEYGAIWEKIAMAVGDPEVRAVALHVNSPGGEVAGCFDLAEKIYQVRDAKPIVAILDECAYSAAYALASSADKIVVPATGGTGSIGVITMHVDMTKMLEQFGIKVSTIQFGERKSDSYPTTPLSDEARARFQADIDVMGEMFVDLVARNRGLAASKVRATEAGCFLGAAGVDQGLADGVMPPDEAFLSIVKEIS
jgi:signal peptide peptidase SppA